MTLEEIGRRAVALTEARARFQTLARCSEKYIPIGLLNDGPPVNACFIDGNPEDWCPGCQRREGLALERSKAARALSVAVNTYRRAQARQKVEK